MAGVLEPVQPPHLSKEQKQAFLRRKPGVAAAIFGAALGSYLISLLTALSADSLLMSIAASLLCGFCIVLLFIVGHDLCHQSFTSSRIANQVIGRIAFLPSLHPFSLWDLGHNRTHHRYNNIRGKDYVWEPMSPADYRASSKLRKLVYRFYRSSTGIFFYYAFEIWVKRMFFVLPGSLPDKRRVHWWDLAMVWLFVAAQLYCIVLAGALFGKGPFTALMLGFIVPFAVWNALMSWAIYLHHIHPGVRWYDTIDTWRSNNGSIAGTVHVHFPLLVRKLLLHIMEHGAHHYLPGVPLYNLDPLQKAVGQGGASWEWSVAEFLRNFEGM